MSYEEFQKKITFYRDYSQEEINLIKKAYDWGKEIYAGIYRKNGEPYLNHCLRTAINLAKFKLDAKTIAAAILHDSLEDGNVDEDVLKTEFDDEIIFLIKGVTKVGHLKYKEKNLIQAENLKKLILYISKDIRVAFIKLADRLDNMRTLQYLPEEKIKRIALETEDIFVSLANRLGISEWAGELSDLALKYLEPEKYNWLKKEIKKKVSGGKNYLNKVKKIIENELKNKNIKFYKIEYRIKRISSIYKKLKRKNFDLEQIYDIFAFRIIVDTVEECYLVLGIIHYLFKPLTHEFDDYIAFPKPNGYKSLHTTVFGPEGKFIEFQIRTQEMHHYNEFGIAANFAYADSKQTKNYQKGISAFANKEDIEILKNLEKDKNIDFNDFFSEKIYVFTPKGDIVTLPSESTPLDFAYKIHTEIGLHFAGAYVNNKVVPLDYKLKNGDVVEIIVDKKRKPSVDWLNIIVSSSAKKKIRSVLKKTSSLLEKEFEAEIEIIANDRIGLLKDIANIISAKKINIVKTKTKIKNSKAYFSFTLKINDKKEISRLKEALKNKIKEIIEIK